MKKINVLYIFKRPVAKDIKKAQIGSYPKDFFYGAINSDQNIEISVFDDFFYNFLLQKIQSLLYIFLLRLFKIGFSIILVITQIKHAKKSDLIFATVDTVGLPLLMMKTLKIFSKPIVINTCGLYDTLLEANSLLYTKIVSNFFKKASLIISGGSFYECRKLSQLLSIPIQKFSFVRFGIDTYYFKPTKKQKTGSYVLVIGADLKRDWYLVKQLAEKFFNLKFVIITLPNLINVELPGNCQVIYNQPIAIVRKYIRNSKFLLIPSFQNYHFAGQSTAFRGMSCAKTVIFTKSFGVSEYKIRNFKQAILIRPSNLSDAIKAFEWINKNENKLEDIGKNAREHILKNCNYQTYQKHITKSISALIK